MSTSDNDYVMHGKSVMSHEASSIESVASKLDDSFAAAVRLILERSKDGHVIVSGMGKAGFVGMKISATLASTGIPSFFLHPAEAVHGDLGRYTAKDTALLMSYSGSTDEVLKIIPQIKRTGCAIVSITGSKESPLAKHSDVVISIGPIKEAGPLGLAPTTSAAVMLCIGDALAMTILKEQNFTPEQFAKFHPAGNLGRSLIPVTQIMRTGNSLCIVDKSTSARDTLGMITKTEGRPGAAAIVDGGVLVGVFTDGNFRRCLEQGESFLNEPVSQHMSTNPKVVSEDAIAADAVKLIKEYKIDQLLVVNEHNQPVGMIDIQDVIDIQVS